MSKFMLVDKVTGAELKAGDWAKDFRGDEVLITGFVPPRHLASTGRVYIKARANQAFPNDYFPSVIGAKIVERS